MDVECMEEKTENEIVKNEDEVVDAAADATQNEKDHIFCQSCGTKNPIQATFCQSCGTDLKNPNSSQGGAVNPPAEEKSHTLAIVLGYIFSVLGGWIGLIFSLYLQSRESPKAVMHGRIQLCILGFWLVVIGLIYNAIFLIIGLIVMIGMIYLIIRDKE